MSEKQIYVVQVANESKRLIEAGSLKKAINFAMPLIVVSHKASAADVVQLMGNGIKVEKAE